MPKPNGAKAVDILVISDEVLVDGLDLIGQLQHRAIDGFIARQRAELAAIADEYTAWMVYPPTPHDDPAEYAPYWVRLTDLMQAPNTPA